MRRKIKQFFLLLSLSRYEIESLISLREESVSARDRVRKFLAYELGNYTVSEIAAHVVLWDRRHMSSHEVGYIIDILSARSHRGGATLDQLQKLWEGGRL